MSSVQVQPTSRDGRKTGARSRRRRGGSAFEFPDVKQRMDAIGFERAPMTPEEHDRLLRRLVGSISKVVVAVGMRAPYRRGRLISAEPKNRFR